MCEPTTIMIGLAVASAAASTASQMSNAKASAKAQGQQAQNQAEEQKAQAEVELGARMKERNQAIARARVAGGEAGIAGNSFALDLADKAGSFNQDAALVSKNLAFAQRATQGQLNSAIAGNRGPNALSAGLSIGSAAASGYAQGQSIEASRAALKT